METKKRGKVEDIRYASQFIYACLRDLKKEIQLSDVHLGRLIFHHGSDEKNSGYLCFYAVFGEPGKREIYYLKAFHGKTERKVQRETLRESQAEAPSVSGTVALMYRQEISPGDSFKANAEYWYYVYNADKTDCVIIDKDTYTIRKLEKTRAKDTNYKKVF